MQITNFKIIMKHYEYIRFVLFVKKVNVFLVQMCRQNEVAYTKSVEVQCKSISSQTDRKSVAEIFYRMTYE